MDNEREPSAPEARVRQRPVRAARDTGQRRRVVDPTPESEDGRPANCRGWVGERVRRVADRAFSFALFRHLSPLPPSALTNAAESTQRRSERWNCVLPGGWMASRQLLQSCCRGANDASSSLSTRRVLDPPPLWANARVKSSRRRARGCLPRGRARLEVRSPIVTQPSSASPPVLSHIRRASSPFCLFSSQPPPPLPRRIRLLSSSLSSTPSKSARPAWRRPRLARCTVSRPPTHPPSLLSGQPLTAPPPLPPPLSVHVLFTVPPAQGTTFARSRTEVQVKPHAQAKGCSERWGSCPLGEVVRAVCANR